MLQVSLRRGQVRSEAGPRSRGEGKGAREKERGKEAAFPKGREHAWGIITGIMRVSRQWHANGKKEKRGSIACVRLCSSPGPGERVIYKYARRVEAGGVVLCLMLSRKRKPKEGEWEF